MDWAELVVGSSVELLGVLIWPAVLLIFLSRFDGQIGGFISRLSSARFKAAGIEADLQAAAEAGAALAAAEGNLGRTPDPSAIARTVKAGIERHEQTRGFVLWVDDRPQNNIYERRALEAQGVEFRLTESTEEALDDLQEDDLSLIISDMGRPGDDRAGYTLLEQVRKTHPNLPFLIYAGSRAPEHVTEARRRGANGTTNNPEELYRMVLRHLSNRPVLS